MIDQKTEWGHGVTSTKLLIGAFLFREYYANGEDVGPIPHDFIGTILDGGPFTRSNGTIVARLYERLTKASRRRVEHLDDNHPNIRNEEIYRAGIYDAYKALQEELSG